MESCRFSSKSLDVQIGDALLNESYLVGQLSTGSNTLLWDLQYAGSQPPLLLLPYSFYERGFPKAKAMVGSPNAIQWWNDGPVKLLRHMAHSKSLVPLAESGIDVDKRAIAVSVKVAH